MNIVVINAANWNKVSDFYQSLIKCIGMADHCGCNVDALLEAMVWDYAHAPSVEWHNRIDAMKPPYTIFIINTEQLDLRICKEIELFAGCLMDARDQYRLQHGNHLEVFLKIVL